MTGRESGAVLIMTPQVKRQQSELTEASSAVKETNGSLSSTAQIKSPGSSIRITRGPCGAIFDGQSSMPEQITKPRISTEDYENDLLKKLQARTSAKKENASSGSKRKISKPNTKDVSINAKHGARSNSIAKSGSTSRTPHDSSELQAEQTSTIANTSRTKWGAKAYQKEYKKATTRGECKEECRKAGREASAAALSEWDNHQ